MKSITKGLVTLIVIALAGLGVSAHAQLQNTGVSNNSRAYATSDGTIPGAIARDNVPMVNWQAAKTIKRSSPSINGQKAATDIVSVYRPLPLCRLMDTRNLGAPIGGPILAANNGRIVTPAGACGIPNGFVVALSASITTQNTTVNNGGFLTFIPTPTSPLVGLNLVFNPGAEWGGTTANIATAGDGSFVAFVAQSNVHLVIDINGYYQDINELDTNAENDINGNTGGDLFQVNNAGTGRAILVGATGTGGTALSIYAGKFAVSGVASGSTATTGSTVFTHTVTAPSIVAPCLARSNIQHPMLNNNPNARIIVTPYNENGTGLTTTGDPPSVIAAEYVGAGNACAANQHRLYFNANAVVGTRYTVMIIAPF